MSPPDPGPVVIELDQTPLPDAPTPAEAPPPSDMPGLPEPAEAEATTRALLATTRRGWGLGRVLLLGLGALATLWIGVALDNLIANLFAATGWLGWVGIGLTALVVLVLLLIALKEVAALARLGRIEELRSKADEALETGSGTAGAEVLSGLDRLYRARADLEWARGDLKRALDDTPDPAGRMELAERKLLAPLDERATEAVTLAARDVAAATALIPLALVDVIAALTINLRMVRQISSIYGGRAGWLGGWRLMRAVTAHLVATGAIAVADDLLGPMLGGGALAKLSRRFGEGAMNGALTARVGVAAMEVCRPMPFAHCDKPSAGSLVMGALKNWRGQARDMKEAE
ncbi:MAG: TIGR01620 family protein [Pseudomonadota bacterium]